MWSLPAAFLALSLLVFEPSILAHGMYVTTDVPVSCMFFAAIYSFYRWVRVPTYLAYATEPWGGPDQTHRYLTDSATDWGQQLLAVKAYTDAHGIHDCWFAYFVQPFVQFQDYGIPCRPLPTYDSANMEYGVPPTITGPVFISYGDLNGFEYGSKVRNAFQSFYERQPDDVILRGVTVYQGTFSVPALAAQRPLAIAKRLMEKDPVAAVTAAQQAVAADPRNFDANLALGDALAATGNKPAARIAWQAAAARIPDMESTAQQQWQPKLQRRLRM